MAHSAVMLGVPIDLKELYETNDRSFLIWLWAICEKVAKTHEQRGGPRNE